MIPDTNAQCSSRQSFLENETPHSRERGGGSPTHASSPAPDELPTISIVVVSLNGAGVLPQLLRSIEAMDYPRERIEVVAVNNGSGDGTGAVLNEWATRGTEAGGLKVRPIHLPQNKGFAGGNNEGMRAATGEWVVLLNDDTEVDEMWARDLMRAGREYPGAGILGTLLLYPDGKTIQHAGGIVRANACTDHFGKDETDTKPHERVFACDYVTGAAFAIRRAVIDRIGLLDPNYWPIYFEEVDYCWRARRAGFEVLQTAARAIHHESRTTVVQSLGYLEKYHRNRLRFVVLNFTVREQLRWLRAEFRWLRETWRGQPMKLLARIYLRSVVRLPKWWWTRMRRRTGSIR